MPNFTFSLADGYASGPQPMELDDIEAARLEASRLVADVIKLEPQTFWQEGGVHLTVSDGNNLTLFEIIVVAAEGRSAGK